MNGPFRVPVRIFQQDQDDPSEFDVLFTITYDGGTQGRDVANSAYRTLLTNASGFSAERLPAQSLATHCVKQLHTFIHQVGVMFDDGNWEPLWSSNRNANLYDVMDDGHRVQHLTVETGSTN